MILDKTYLGSTEIEKIYLGSNVVYEVGGGGGNIILNGTFDDTANLTVGNNYTVSGGKLNYLGSQDNNEVTFALSEDIVNGGVYDVEFTISGGGTARPRLRAGDNTGDVITYTNYSDGTYTVTYTHVSADVSIVTLQSRNSSGGGAYSLDDFTITKTN